MLKTIFPLIALLLISGCAANSGRDAKAEKKGFVPLFNGKDLSGWAYGSAKGKESKAGAGYQVRDGGILYCTVADGGNLFTEKEYGNFVLRFDFKLAPGANNGVAIRAPRDGNAAYEGMEIQILDDTAERYSKLRPEQYHGSIYDVAAAKRGHLNPVGEWNHEEIIANGRHITVKLNGHTITDANLDDIKDEAKLKKHPGIQKQSGHIGFLGHGAEIEFRNLEIKEL
ncbi:MAG: hypothetical protein QOE14_1193 [Humisphaera sp.]|nr:hypothetical protein [Humisphaera sp.]